LHLNHRANQEVLKCLPAHPQDWLALVGDVADEQGLFDWALRWLKPRWARLLWVPGNHELWTQRGPEPSADLRGERRYRHFVELCRSVGVLTPEDPYPRWPQPDGPYLIAPMFLLYDYSFRPDEVPYAKAVPWAVASGVRCKDERRLDPEPYADRAAWCAHRCAITEARLRAELPSGVRSVLINHYPLRRELARLPSIPRFSIWCGTRRTESWPRRFRAEAAVYGHLHIPQRRCLDGVRFEEVSLGYPRQWRDRTDAPEDHLRQILPAPGA
jgi:predicted phosphodiesterase